MSNWNFLKSGSQNCSPWGIDLEATFSHNAVSLSISPAHLKETPLVTNEAGYHGLSPRKPRTTIRCVHEVTLSMFKLAKILSSNDVRTMKRTSILCAKICSLVSSAVLFLCQYLCIAPCCNNCDNTRLNRWRSVTKYLSSCEAWLMHCDCSRLSSFKDGRSWQIWFAFDRTCRHLHATCSTAHCVMWPFVVFAGWLFKVKLADEADLKELMKKDAYEAFCHEESWDSFAIPLKSLCRSSL